MQEDLFMDLFIYGFVLLFKQIEKNVLSLFCFLCFTVWNMELWLMEIYVFLFRMALKFLEKILCVMSAQLHLL